jgi:hypothetical protein
MPGSRLMVKACPVPPYSQGKETPRQSLQAVIVRQAKVTGHTLGRMRFSASTGPGNRSHKPKSMVQWCSETRRQGSCRASCRRAMPDRSGEEAFVSQDSVPICAKDGFPKVRIAGRCIGGQRIVDLVKCGETVY